MSDTNLIPTAAICTYHEVDFTFINSLSEAGLITFEVINKTSYIPLEELKKLETMIRLHNELEINLAGIEAINHLLDRIGQMQEEIRLLGNRVRF